MNTFNRFRSFGTTQKGGVLTLLLCVLVTVVWIQFGGKVVTGAGMSPGFVHTQTGVRFQASLSQPMVVQGSDGSVYMNLSIVTPETRNIQAKRVSTDTIVVLDRSGSMGEDNKWRYATQAVSSLIDRLKRNDRIAFITFDSTARLESPLVWATPDNVQLLKELVAHLAPGDSTNLGDGLLVAERIAQNSVSSERRSRILLLSDGHANEGIVSQEGLGAISRRISDHGSIISTIGMGLGFNETLMASLADEGMGRFSYLEHLESLAAILSSELADSRQVFADASEVRMQLPAGVELLDAAGYPFSLEGNTAVIRTGQLFQDSTKRFMATLRIPSHTLAEYTIDGVDLRFRVGGRFHQHALGSTGMTIACVAPERQIEVLASIDKDLYREVWTRNNLGSVMKKVGDLVRTGERDRAKELVEEYRSSVEEASAVVPDLKNEAERQLDELASRVDDAFQGADQETKQNRAAKALLDSSQRLQRQTDRNTQ